MADRNLRVRIGNSISASGDVTSGDVTSGDVTSGDVTSGDVTSGDVTSGVIQGTSLRPIFYATFIDSLLRAIRLPSQDYADNLQFIADISVCTRADVQNEINTIAGWTDEHGTPLSVDKCSVLHCGLHQPNHECLINSTRISSVESAVWIVSQTWASSERQTAHTRSTAMTSLLKPTVRAAH